MKKALVLMLAVLLLGTVGMARIDNFDYIVVYDDATIVGDLDVDGVTDLDDLSIGTSIAPLDWSAKSGSNSGVQVHLTGDGTGSATGLKGADFRATVSDGTTQAVLGVQAVATRTTGDASGKIIYGGNFLAFLNGGQVQNAYGAVGTLNIAAGAEIPTALPSIAAGLCGVTWIDTGATITYAKDVGVVAHIWDNVGGNARRKADAGFMAILGGDTHDTDCGAVLSAYSYNTAGGYFDYGTDFSDVAFAVADHRLDDGQLIDGGDVEDAVANKATTVEYAAATQQTVLTFTLTGDHDLDLADGDHGTGIKVYDFPEGRILILGATINAVVVTSANYEASPNDVFVVACGTVVGADDNALTGTEVDIIPSTELDTVGATVLTLDWHAALAASAQFDGTGTAIDLYVNVACTDASASGANTYAITGTLTVTWVNLGDY